MKPSIWFSEAITAEFLMLLSKISIDFVVEKYQGQSILDGVGRDQFDDEEDVCWNGAASWSILLPHKHYKINYILHTILAG